MSSEQNLEAEAIMLQRKKRRNRILAIVLTVVVGIPLVISLLALFLELVMFLDRFSYFASDFTSVFVWAVIGSLTLALALFLAWFGKPALASGLLILRAIGFMAGFNVSFVYTYGRFFGWHGNPLQSAVDNDFFTGVSEISVLLVAIVVLVIALIPVSRNGLNAAVQIPEGTYYFVFMGETYGPVDASGLISSVQSGHVTSQTMVSFNSGAWFLAGQVPGLFIR